MDFDGYGGYGEGGGEYGAGAAAPTFGGSQAAHEVSPAGKKVREGF